MAILVYDITNKASFNSVGQWLEECRIHGHPDMTLLLVGNKTDLSGQRQVSLAEGEALALKHGMLFSETSAKMDSKVAETFMCAADSVMSKIVDGRIDPRNEAFGVKLGPLAGKADSTLLHRSLIAPKKSGCCQ